MINKKRLSEFSRFSGCGAKLGPAMLDRALCDLKQTRWPGVIADFHGSEDAGVFKLDDSKALVQTIDFFPPISDDPLIFGEIAAANALSDIYAMGAKPVTAVSVVCFPEEELEIDWLRKIMQGGLNKLEEAETALLGGHSVSDRELKFGFSVNGVISPDQAVRNNTPRPGDALILTKPLGTGTVNTAMKAGMVSSESLEAAETSMRTLNRRASELIFAAQVSAMTDVTGFGLIGHAAEMLLNSNCRFVIEADKLPLIPGAVDYISLGLVPEGTFRNRDFRLPFLEEPDSLDPELVDLLFDPQTSGGLLASLPLKDAEAVIKALSAEGYTAAVIGQVEKGEGKVRIYA